MFTNAKITHYSKKNEYKRSYYDVYTEQTTSSMDSKAGSTKKDTVFISIPTDKPLDFRKGDLIVIGEAKETIDASTEQSESEGFKALKKGNTVYTVSTVEPCLYGSVNMWHYELECS